MVPGHTTGLPATQKVSVTPDTTSPPPPPPQSGLPLPPSSQDRPFPNPQPPGPVYVPCPQPPGPVSTPCPQSTPMPDPGPIAEMRPPTPSTMDIPRALRVLMPHNAPGLKEQDAPEHAEASPGCPRRSTRRIKQSPAAEWLSCSEKRIHVKLCYGHWPLSLIFISSSSWSYHSFKVLSVFSFHSKDLGGIEDSPCLFISSVFVHPISLLFHRVCFFLFHLFQVACPLMFSLLCVYCHFLNKQ